MASLALTQIQSIGVLVGAAGLICLVLLFAGGTDDRWFAQTRARIRHSRAAAHPQNGSPPEHLSREHEQRADIEARLEQERARDALREPD